MNCFQHTNKPAVGHCTFCGRGLCHECATVVDGKLSCRGSCQQEIARERRVLAQSETAITQRSVVYETSSGVYQRSFAFSAVFGMAALIFGIFMIVGRMPIAGAVVAAMGIVFLINGLGMARASKKFKKLAAEGRDEGLQT
jgi:Flp pilus assembly protein TadB